MMYKGLLFSVVVMLIVFASCSKEGPDGVDESVVRMGSLEVTAELVDIPGEFVNRKDYDYAFVVKYKVKSVHRGEAPGEFLYVGHYNPLKARSEAADARVEEVGGDLKKIRVGEVHRMALEVPIDEHYMGGIINRYFGKEETGPIYWAVWTNAAS